MRIVDPETGKSHIEKRRRRYNEAGQPRELTFSCYRRFAFFSHERTCAWFCQALEDARAKFGFQVWAYVLMPDHVHLLVYPGEAALDMSRFLQAVKQPVARRAIEHLKVHAPQWLDRLTVREGTRLRHRFWQPGGGYDLQELVRRPPRHVGKVLARAAPYNAIKLLRCLPGTGHVGGPRRFGAVEPDPHEWVWERNE